jgi:diguanylate cyclase (GGDEF)-like protein
LRVIERSFRALLPDHPVELLLADNSHAHLTLQATPAGLTGLLNRRAFENGYVRVRGASRMAAVAMAHLDHFKALNDTYGHDTGDRALRVFAETLRTCLRGEDLVSRRGGEEFASFFPGSGAGVAVAALRRVRAELQRALRTSGLPVCTASFGVVEPAATRISTPC